MLRWLPPPIKGALFFVFLALNVLFWCVPLLTIALFKLLIPLPAWQRLCTRALIWIAEQWIEGNTWMMRQTQRMNWQVTGLDGLNYDGWYLITANHYSWADIFVLQAVFNRRIPFLKFFLKQELIYIPVMGLAWWALDFPFMKRYSRDYLARNPHKRGEDLETTRRACEKFKHVPVSIINFMEGTRNQPQRHAKQGSPFTYLLKPKAGGIAFVTAAMGEQIKTLLNVTLVYPENDVRSLRFWDFLCGRITRVIVHVEQMEIPPELLAGDYMNDDAFREMFQGWVNELWLEKDRLIGRLLHEERNLQTA